MKNKLSFLKIYMLASGQHIKIFLKSQVFVLFTFLLLVLAITPQAAQASDFTVTGFDPATGLFDVTGFTHSTCDSVYLYDDAGQPDQQVVGIEFTPACDSTHLGGPTFIGFTGDWPHLLVQPNGPGYGEASQVFHFPNDITIDGAATPTPGVLGAAVTLEPTTQAKINAGVGSLGTTSVKEMADILPFVWPVLAILIVIAVAIGFFKRRSGLSGDAVSTNSWVESSEGIKSHEHFE